MLSRLVGKLASVELLASNGLTAGKLGGDMLAIKGLENFADIRVLHGVNVLEEGDEANEVLVVAVTLPGVEDNGVLGLVADVLGIGVDNYDLGEVSVQIREVLYC